MKAIEKYDWMFRGMIANLPSKEVAGYDVRKGFTQWFEQLCNEIDKDIERLESENDNLNDFLFEAKEKIKEGIK